LESFLSCRIVLQGEKKPLSRAIRGKRSPDGYWQANKGHYSFPFAFQLPSDVPSCFEFKNVLAVRYKVTG
jgi:hypothetical protein